MKLIQTLMLFVGALVTVAPQVHADVLIRLQSGVTMRGSSSWVDGDTVKFMYRGGVIGFPKDQVVAVENAAPLPVNLAPVTTAERAVTASAPATTAPAPANVAAQSSGGSGDAAAADKAAGDSHPPAAPITTTDPDLAPVPHEDLDSRMERLDKLSLKAHRDLTIMRNQGEASAESLDHMQRRVDEINRQRGETMDRLKAIR